MQNWLRYSLLATATATGAAHWRPGTDSTPAYYAVPPHRPDAPLLSGGSLSGQYFSHPFQVVAYQMAGRIEHVLYAQPCYCRCDRALRHKSLHSCFEGTHGAICGTCMRQAIYAYQETKLGKTPDQIRAEIQQGEWQNVKLEDAAL